MAGNRCLRGFSLLYCKMGAMSARCHLLGYGEVLLDLLAG